MCSATRRGLLLCCVLCAVGAWICSDTSLYSTKDPRRQADRVARRDLCSQGLISPVSALARLSSSFRRR